MTFYPDLPFSPGSQLLVIVVIQGVGRVADVLLEHLRPRVLLRKRDVNALLKPVVGAQRQRYWQTKAGNQACQLIFTTPLLRRLGT